MRQILEVQVVNSLVTQFSTQQLVSGKDREILLPMFNLIVVGINSPTPIKMNLQMTTLSLITGGRRMMTGKQKPFQLSVLLQRLQQISLVPRFIQVPHKMNGAVQKLISLQKEQIVQHLLQQRFLLQKIGVAGLVLITVGEKAKAKTFMR